MEARLNPSLAPHFWDLDPIKQFQPLCADLLAKEPGIASADEYGINGQGQRGIDILGKDINGQITVVGQCKCKRPEKFEATEVIKAADEFYKYCEEWKKEGVTHFILMVACDLSDRKIQDEIRNQRKRFIEINIYFDAWSGSILRNKLMPYPAIAQRHIHSQEVLRNICGPTVQGLIFTPNASIETTLQELREAMCEPDHYYAHIEELFIEEAKKVISVAQNSPLNLSFLTPMASDLFSEYLQPFINITEKLVRLSATLIKLDRQKKFTEILIKIFKLLAQDPLKFENSGTRGYIPGVPEIRLYPLALMIYTIYIVGVEYKSTNLLQEITQIRFRSQRSELKNQNLPGILWCMYDEQLTVTFFEVIQQNSYYPLPKTIRDTLLPWLKQYLDFPDDAYYKGEFILSLTLLETNEQRLFPPLYIYQSKSKDTLTSFITEKKCLKELFPNIENRLQLFDQLSIKISKGVIKNGQYYFNDYGFHGNAYNLYQNS
jgi:hypothetical protein